MYLEVEWAEEPERGEQTTFHAACELGWQFNRLSVGLSFGPSSCPSVKLIRSHVQNAQISIPWSQNFGWRIGPSFGPRIGP